MELVVMYSMIAKLVATFTCKWHENITEDDA